MTTELPTKAKLNKVLTDLMRRPRTAEVATAINKVKGQIRTCPR
jgi:hypothetical protein